MTTGSHPVISRRYGLWRVAECFFHYDGGSEIPPRIAADVVDFVQLPAPLGFGSWTEFPTLVVDLRGEADCLLAGMNQTTRYEVTRASKEEVACSVHVNPDRAICEEFAGAYAPFRDERGLSSAVPRRLCILAEHGHLQLSMARDAEGIVSWHSYLTAAGRARLLHSVTLGRDGASSARRAQISRAHRFHHWRDIVHFRETGFDYYDFGGWYPGTEDAQRLTINRFKEGFGGTRATTFNGVASLTRRGRALVELRRRRQD